MASLNRPARLNRTLLALLGVTLLAAGAFTVATHVGRLRMVDPATPLVPGTAVPPTSVLYVTAGLAVVLGLLCLRWLLAQLAHRPKTHTWRLERDGNHGRTEIAASTATEPFTGEVAALPGVHSARATLTGTRNKPALTMTIVVQQDGDLSAIHDDLDRQALPRLRHALDLATLPAAVEFRLSTKTGVRAR